MYRPMFFFSRNKPYTAVINGQSIGVLAQETILAAALRNGIAFPHSCRVGGCASCKCNLKEGKVKQLTNASYILSDDDLDNGCILACQSVPRSDVRIDVDNSATAAARKTRAKVLACDLLTHDIARVRVQLEESLPYRAGQFATLELDALPGVARSYSFAAPHNPNGQTTFFVRKVPGGEFSSFVHEQVKVGSYLNVDGPSGSFWLRPGSAPLLLIAGGSGLAPILAMLEENAAKNGGPSANPKEARPVTLLFGARTQRDLYEQKTIAALQEKWAGPVTYLPVLSEEPESSSWQGARGLVSTFIDAGLAASADIYLCGPPPMVDAAQQTLLAAGARAEKIHADRFTTLKDTTTLGGTAHFATAALI